MSSNKKSPPTGAGKPGGGGGKRPQVEDLARKNDVVAGNSNGGGETNPNLTQSGPSEEGFETQKRRQGKRNNSGSTRTGYTPRAKMSKTNKPRHPAKFSAVYENGKRVETGEAEAVVEEVKTEVESLPAGAAKPGGGGGVVTGAKPKSRGAKKSKKNKNTPGKIPSKIINKVPVGGLHDLRPVRNARDQVSQTLSDHESDPNSKSATAPAAATDTRPPPKGAGAGPNSYKILTKTVSFTETRIEAEARLDLERKNATKPPTPEREEEIEAELLALSLRIESEPEVITKPTYASKLKASLEEAYAVLYLHSGADKRSELLEEDFDKVIASVQDQFITMAMEKKSFPKWKWISWSENRGLIAANSEEDVNFFINIVKNTRVQGSEQKYRLWRVTEFEERHLVTVNLTAALARLGEERCMDSIMCQNPLSGKVERAWIGYNSKDAEWTIKFFADKKLFWELIELRGEGQGRKLWLAMGGGEVLAHLSKDPGVAQAEAEARAKKKAEAVAVKARLKAEAKAVRDGKPRVPDATDQASGGASEDVKAGVDMEHSGTGDSGLTI